MKKSTRSIDHILLLTPDLGAARGVYEGFGFLMTPYGDHRPLLGTANHTVTFPTTFLELLAIIDEDIPSAVRREDVARRAGVHMMGFKTEDVAADAASFARQAPGQWTEERVSTRRMTLANGETVTGSIDYTMQQIELNREVRFFVGKNTTAGVTWNPDFLNHANGARRIMELHFIADEGRETLLRDLTMIHGEDCMVESGGQVAFHTENEALIVKSASDVDFEPTSRAPYVAGLKIEVADCEALAALLTRNGRVFQRRSDGAISIRPEDAYGLYLEFAERT